MSLIQGSAEVLGVDLDAGATTPPVSPLLRPRRLCGRDSADGGRVAAGPVQKASQKRRSILDDSGAQEPAPGGTGPMSLLEMNALTQLRVAIVGNAVDTDHDGGSTAVELCQWLGPVD